jgi:hypothetical protein
MRLAAENYLKAAEGYATDDENHTCTSLQLLFDPWAHTLGFGRVLALRFGISSDYQCPSCHAAPHRATFERGSTPNDAHLVRERDNEKRAGRKEEGV